MIREINYDSVEKIEIPVKYDGRRFLLREASGDAARKYNNARTAKLTFGKGGVVTKAEGMGDLEPLLVSLCLVELVLNSKTQQEEEKPVPMSEVGKFPYKLQKKLHDTVKEISDLDESDKPLKKAFQKALGFDNAPITWDKLKSWVGALDEDDEEFDPLRSLFKDSPEDKAKNESSGMEDG
jgi:hypothetical protein